MGGQYKPCTHGGEAATCETCVSRRERKRLTKLRERRSRPHVVRDSNLWQLYRLRLQDYDVLLAAQDRRCAICGTHEDDVDRSHVGGLPRHDGTPSTRTPLAVDHCHQTGVVRGLLCPPCNRAIGLFKEDPQRLLAAVAYLGEKRDTGFSVVGGYVWRRRNPVGG